VIGPEGWAEPRRRTRVGDALEPNNLRLVFAGIDAVRGAAADLRADLAFARTVARALGPGRHRDRPMPVGPVFPPRRPLAATLAGQRVAVVASGGSGATSALIGVQRAFEDAGIRPALISACSGSVLFASLWAAGLTSDEIADLWLGLRTGDYVDPDWRALGRAARHRLRGFAGLLRGDAIERTYRRRLGDLRLGQTPIPLSAVVWNIDHNRVEYLSSRATPDVPVARAARIAISIPLMVEPVLHDGTWYGDGGIVDIFPAQPVLDAGPFDLVVGTNSYLSPGFDGDDVSGWHDRTWSIFRASGQLRYAVYLELAREHVRRLGRSLVLVEPVPHAEVHGAHFYTSFLDRRDWPRYMRLGHAAARAALAARAIAVSASPPVPDRVPAPPPVPGLATDLRRPVA